MSIAQNGEKRILVTAELCQASRNRCQQGLRLGVVLWSFIRNSAVPNRDRLGFVGHG
jgi:hypothetical protein